MKINQKDFTLGYSVRVEQEGRYEITTVSIFSGEVKTLASRLDGAIGNKAGYGSEQTAIDVAQETQAAIDAGSTHWFDKEFIDSNVHVTVKYQRYDETTFCDPRIDVGSDMKTIPYGATLVTRIAGKKRFPESPDELVACLKRHVPCKRWGHEYIVTSKVG